MCCRAGSKWYTFAVGVLCWHVLLPVPSRCPCWTVAQSMGLLQCLLLYSFPGLTFPSHSAFFAKKKKNRAVHESVRHDVEPDRSCRCHFEGYDLINDLRPRCRMRVERVGEATNPGPPRTRAVSIPTTFSTWFESDSDDDDR